MYVSISRLSFNIVIAHNLDYFACIDLGPYWPSPTGSLWLLLPGSGSDSGAAAVEGDVRGVGGEPCQDAVRIPVGKRVDLHRVVGARRHQLAFLWGKKTYKKNQTP